MVKINAGKYKGQKLLVPKSASPLTDRLKIKYFDNLAGLDLKQIKVLDLFAGSGVWGFEILSRGAAAVQFVELSDQAIDILHTNAYNLQTSESTKIIQADSFELLGIVMSLREFKQFNLILIDPPFSLTSEKNFEQYLLKLSFSKQKTTIVSLKTPKNWNFPDLIKSELKILPEVVAGTTKIVSWQ